MLNSPLSLITRISEYADSESVSSPSGRTPRGAVILTRAGVLLLIIGIARASLYGDGLSGSPRLSCTAEASPSLAPVSARSCDAEMAEADLPILQSLQLHEARIATLLPKPKARVFTRADSPYFHWHNHCPLQHSRAKTRKQMPKIIYLTRREAETRCLNPCMWCCELEQSNK